MSNSKHIEWKLKIQDWQNSGLTQTEWCHRNQIPHHRFLFWRKQFCDQKIPEKPSVKFIDLEQKDEGTIELHHFMIRFSAQTNSNTILDCLRALRENRC